MEYLSYFCIIQIAMDGVVKCWHAIEEEDFFSYCMIESHSAMQRPSHFERIIVNSDIGSLTSSSDIASK